MNKNELAKFDAKKLMNKMGPKGAVVGKPGDAPAADRREQRERDRALGLVPFAVKLNGDLVKQLQAQSKEQGVDLNELVARLLQKGLAA